MNNQNNPNRLVNEKSPYLQQHSNNPVDWYPWGEEAFQKAKSEDKPIFLSIGYSTCHWCHVMEKESFEDYSTAQLMNEYFVNIKVDREERPDIDNVYMTALQSLTGSGGWPLSAFLTPGLKPFYLGTYFPNRAAYNRPSFVDLLKGINKAWIEKNSEIIDSSSRIIDSISKSSIIFKNDQIDVSEIEKKCLEHFVRAYDSLNSGFGNAPKFPRPSIFEFLLRCNYYLSDIKSLEMTENTLLAMSRGGMYDQLGGGFSRYSVDEFWKVPHFEKMLYDQAQLLSSLSDTFLITRNNEIEIRIIETIEYIKRDLLDNSGAFYSAEDADSEGVEGKFYAWTIEEVSKILNEKELRIFILHYGFTTEGNFEHNKNVLHIFKNIDEIESETQIDKNEIIDLLKSSKTKLFNERLNRIRPHRDEKIISAWNGLLISGLVKSFRAINNLEYLKLAENCADAIIENMFVNGILNRRMKDKEVKINGFLDDYSFMIAGLIDLYEASANSKYIKLAEDLLKVTDKLFYDSKNGGYFNTSGLDPSVLIRTKSEYDSAEPSGNSIMAMNLLKLGSIFNDDNYIKKSNIIVNLFISHTSAYPSAMPYMLAVKLDSMKPLRQIVFSSTSKTIDNTLLQNQIFKNYNPNAVIIYNDEYMYNRIELLKDMMPINDKPTVYICENFTCKLPSNVYIK
jgi:uncharacterized protein YyaL (SSP411 family)